MSRRSALIWYAIFWWLFAAWILFGCKQSGDPAPSDLICATGKYKADPIKLSHWCTTLKNFNAGNNVVAGGVSYFNNYTWITRAVKSCDECK